MTQTRQHEVNARHPTLSVAGALAAVLEGWRCEESSSMGTQDLAPGRAPSIIERAAVRISRVATKTAHSGRVHVPLSYGPPKNHHNTKRSHTQCGQSLRSSRTSSLPNCIVTGMRPAKKKCGLVEGFFSVRVTICPVTHRRTALPRV